MKKTHWIIWRREIDPPGVHPVAVRHSREEALVAVRDAAQIEADQANARREADFQQGGSTGRMVRLGDFDHQYNITHLTE